LTTILIDVRLKVRTIPRRKSVTRMRSASRGLVGVTDILYTIYYIDSLGTVKKQNWRCGMNRTLSYGAKLFAHLDPSKGVDAYRQQDGGHGSRNPLRSVSRERHERTQECLPPRMGSSISGIRDGLHGLSIHARQSHCGNSLNVHCIRSLSAQSAKWHYTRCSGIVITAARRPAQSATASRLTSLSRQPTD
jgi:hypothetical protein